MLGDFYQTPLVKDCWIFYSLNDSINALAPNFWKNNVKCYELTLVMQQTNTKFIKTLNKFCTYTKTFKNIQYINSNCCQRNTKHFNYTTFFLYKYFNAKT